MWTYESEQMYVLMERATTRNYNTKDLYRICYVVYNYILYGLLNILQTHNIANTYNKASIATLGIITEYYGLLFDLLNEHYCTYVSPLCGIFFKFVPVHCSFL